MCADLNGNVKPAIDFLAHLFDYTKKLKSKAKKLYREKRKK